MAETTITEQLTRLSKAKDDLKTSIKAKQPSDVTFSAARLDEYAAEVDKIVSTKSLTGATVEASDILANEVAYGNNGEEITGTMPRISVSPIEIITKDTTVSVGKGYNPTAATIKIPEAEQAKIAAENIKTGITILGTSGTFTQENEAKSITAPYVFHGLVGFVNGKKVTGTMPEYNGEKELLYIDTKLVNDTIIVPQNVKFPSSNITYLYLNDLKGSTEYKVGASELKVQLSRTDNQRNYQLKSFVGNSFIAESQIHQFPKLFDELYPEGTGFFTQENKNTIIWNIPFVNLSHILEYYHNDGMSGYNIRGISDLSMAEDFDLYYDYNQTQKSGSDFNYSYGFNIVEDDFNKDLYFTTKNARLSIFGVSFPIKKGKIRVDTIIGQVYLSYQLPCDIMYEASQSNFQPIVSGTYSNSLSWSNLPSSIQSGTIHTIKVIPTGLDYISKGFITTMNKGVN